MRRQGVCLFLQLGCLALVVVACAESRPKVAHEAAGSERLRLVFKLQPLGGEPGGLEGLLSEFAVKHPELEVVTQSLPNASDVAHQYYLTALEGGATDFDVLVADVIWIPEFAKAGWIADLSEWFPPAPLAETFLAGPVEACVVEGRTYAVPWYVDVGLLYYRTDLVPQAPRTYEALRTAAREVMKDHPEMLGYVWQGRQYEGLSCNVFEALWGHGGEAWQDGRVRLQTQEGVAALSYLRELLATGISPPWTTSAAEEQSRLAFQQGRAVFMRNWPYAYAAAQQEGSPIRGKVGFAPLPTLTGEPGAGALGGWQLAINAHVSPEKKAAAAKLIAHLTSLEANRVMALHHARNPARRDAYADEALRARAPFIAGLREAVERARPRPVTPYYNLISDVLQGEFSAAVSGLRSPEDALGRAQEQVDHLMGMGR